MCCVLTDVLELVVMCCVLTDELELVVMCCVLTDVFRQLVIMTDDVHSFITPHLMNTRCFFM